MFSDKERGAFNTLKVAFMKALVLQYPDQDHEFQLETDASKFAVSGVLSVKGDDSDFRPVIYMSHLMTLSRPVPLAAVVLKGSLFVATVGSTVY